MNAEELAELGFNVRSLGAAITRAYIRDRWLSIATNKEHEYGDVLPPMPPISVEFEIINKTKWRVIGPSDFQEWVVQQKSLGTLTADDLALAEIWRHSVYFYRVEAVSDDKL